MGMLSMSGGDAAFCQITLRALVIGRVEAGLIASARPLSYQLLLCVVQGSICDDAVCVVCCPCCVAVQMGQELKYHRLA